MYVKPIGTFPPSSMRRNFRRGSTSQLRSGHTKQACPEAHPIPWRCAGNPHVGVAVLQFALDLGGMHKRKSIPLHVLLGLALLKHAPCNRSFSTQTGDTDAYCSFFVALVKVFTTPLIERGINTLINTYQCLLRRRQLRCGQATFQLCQRFFLVFFQFADPPFLGTNGQGNRASQIAVRSLRQL